MAKITKQLEPLYHNVNVRTEFRLEAPNLKFSDMRLLNIYFADAEGLDIDRQSNGGVTEYIKSITLLSGNIQIDRCDNLALLGCHRENSVSNRTNRFLQRHLKQNEYCFTTQIKDNFENDLIFRKTPVDYNGVFGYLNLSDYLLFLKATPVFNFPNIRLVIEWSDLAKTSVTNEEPFLVYEEAVGEGQPEWPGVVYNSWEMDRFRVGAVAENATQSVKYRVQGFNNKRVNRLLLAFTPELVDTTLNAKLCSPPQKEEQYQVYWNNIAIYPQDIDDKLKSRIMLDTWGNKTQPFGQDLYNVSFYQNNIVFGDMAEPTQSWAGVDMQSLPITNLQIGYKRTGFDLAGTPDVGLGSLLIFLYGEVVKQVSFNNKGQPVVAYL